MTSREKDKASRLIGGSGLRITPVSLGTVNFGHVTDLETSFQIMSRALERGVTLFDTANIYNYKSDQDCTEAIVGEWLSQDPCRRDRVVLNTKVFGHMGSGLNESGLSARHVQMQCEASLRRLRTDRLDVYTLHHVDRNTPFDETLFALEQLRLSGKILYYSTSNFAAWQLVTLLMIAKEIGAPGPLFEQSHYNLKVRDVEREVLPACRAHKIGFLAFSPLAEAVLAGTRAGVRRNTWDIEDRRATERGRLEPWNAACEQVGIDPAIAAMAWLVGRPGVTSIVAGPRTVEQLDTAVDAAETRLPSELLATADEIWPGPGEAPEAYAW